MAVEENESGEVASPRTAVAVHTHTHTMVSWTLSLTIAAAGNTTDNIKGKIK